jgi:ABC-type transport system involved in cytochrome bd biosynthesis fused ATPase/permease subunit
MCAARAFLGGLQFSGGSSQRMALTKALVVVLEVLFEGKDATVEALCIVLSHHSTQASPVKFNHHPTHNEMTVSDLLCVFQNRGI